MFILIESRHDGVVVPLNDVKRYKQATTRKRRNQKEIPRQFSRGGGWGWGVQIPRRGLTENFNIAKINNLAIPGGGVGGPDPLPTPPLDPPMPHKSRGGKKLK